MVALRRILASWGIERFHVQRQLRGSFSSNWVIDAGGSLYVLRRAVDDEDYVDYQVRVIAHLAASDFPYDVPKLVAPTGSRPSYVAADGAFWILYPFIEGRHPSGPSTASRAVDVGRLVAHYARAIEGFERSGEQGDFELELFDRAGTRSRLATTAEALTASTGVDDLRRAFLERADLLLARYGEISDADVRRVGELPKITIYNDWTPGNHLVDAGGAVRGVIDFDSVLEAPRIVDLQNALTYVLVAAPAGREASLVKSFCEGYAAVLPLGRDELDLVHPVALDRLAGLIVRRVAAAVREPLPRRELIAIRLVELFCWISDDWRRRSP